MLVGGLVRPLGPWPGRAFPPSFASAPLCGPPLLGGGFTLLPLLGVLPFLLVALSLLSLLTLGVLALVPCVLTVRTWARDALAPGRTTLPTLHVDAPGRTTLPDAPGTLPVKGSVR